MFLLQMDVLIEDVREDVPRSMMFVGLYDIVGLLGGDEETHMT